MKVLTMLARRFVAGETIHEALEQVRLLDAEGIKVTLDNLGEDTSSREQADAARAEYVEMLQRIGDAGLTSSCNVSLKLTQFGQNLSDELARDNLVRVAEIGKKLGNFVRLDMESTRYTQRTLDLFYALQPEFPNIGVVIQAYLRRSEADVKKLVERKARVRLCKGAYKEPPELAFPDKREVNENYDRLAKLLCAAPIPAFATHDDERINRAVAAAAAAGLKKDEYEIQMLYGLRGKRWRELVKNGHIVRVYMPYGTHWMPYFSRRVRERKENWMFVVKNLFS